MEKLILDGESLTVEDVIRAGNYPSVEVIPSEEAVRRVEENRAVVDELLKNGETVYGLNTGFGSKSQVKIDEQRLKQHQRNLILSHSAGVGEELPIEVVRSTMLLRLNTILKGNSGVRPVIVSTLTDMLNRGVVPVVLSQGSVGASGDLAPLSHITLVMMKDEEGDDERVSGEAYLYDRPSSRWHRMSGRSAMELAGIERIVLEPKEGLALNNGLQVSTAIACRALYKAKLALKYSNIAMAMSAEGLLSSLSPFSDKMHRVRPHTGAVEVAGEIRRLLEGSELIDSEQDKVQDAYSIRCYPQVAGVLCETIKNVEETLTVEINSSTDNPLIFTDDGDVLSGGNFHGEPIANAMDRLTIALTELGGISDRRSFRLLNGDINEGLPSMLIEDSGFNSGFMLAQYTSASLVSENKSLSYPTSVDSIPTSDNQEDYVSMSPISARKAERVSENTLNILAIELLLASQALDFRMRGINFEPKLDNRGNLIKKRIETEGLKPSPVIEKIHKIIREYVPYRESDDILYEDINALRQMIEDDGIENFQ